MCSTSSHSLLSGAVVDAVKAGQLEHIFVIGGAYVVWVVLLVVLLVSLLYGSIALVAIVLLLYLSCACCYSI
jgi:hypothetical protein